MPGDGQHPRSTQQTIIIISEKQVIIKYMTQKENCSISLQDSLNTKTMSDVLWLFPIPQLRGAKSIGEFYLPLKNH